MSATQIDLALWILASAVRLAWVWLTCWVLIECGWLAIHWARRVRK